MYKKEYLILKTKYMQKKNNYSTPLDKKKDTSIYIIKGRPIDTIILDEIYSTNKISIHMNIQMFILYNSTIYKLKHPFVSDYFLRILNEFNPEKEIEKDSLIKYENVTQVFLDEEYFFIYNFINDIPIVPSCIEIFFFDMLCKNEKLYKHEITNELDEEKIETFRSAIAYFGIKKEHIRIDTDVDELKLWL